MNRNVTYAAGLYTQAISLFSVKILRHCGLHVFPEGQSNASGPKCCASGSCIMPAIVLLEVSSN